MSTSEPPRKAVAFSVESTARYTEKSHKPNIAKQVFERFDGRELTDTMLEEAAQLFNENYGIWGEDPTNPRPTPKPGKSHEPILILLSDIRIGSRVMLSKTRLRAQYLPDNVTCSYVRVTIEDRLAGNAFACRWRYKDKIVCWVTQLVVHSDFRERGLAASLLNQLRQDDDAIYGLLSSHPAACLAAAKAFGSKRHTTLPYCDFDIYILIGGINAVAVGFIRDNAEAIMNVSPISYVKDAELRGSLFDPEDTSGAISSVYTNFFVDHTEPLAALEWVREGLDWPLGELLDGYEFLFMIQNRRRDRSRSRSASQPRSKPDSA
jgi:GNAT superfamily N-acetyltransferase